MRGRCWLVLLVCAAAGTLVASQTPTEPVERVQRLQLLRRLWKRRQRDRMTRNRTVQHQHQPDLFTSVSSSFVDRHRQHGADTSASDGYTERTLFDWSQHVSSPNVSRSLANATEGQVRVSGGRGPYEGNLEIYHDGRWGHICDDEWDMLEAEIACNQLGYPSAQKPSHDGHFGHPETVFFWMDNLYCSASESTLSECLFEGWGVHDCSPSELAGVTCRGRRLEDNKATGTSRESQKLKTRKTQLWPSTVEGVQLRLNGGRIASEGRLEMNTNNEEWGVVCGNGWGLLQANIACQTLGYGFAASALQTDYFGGKELPKSVSGFQCVGNESSLFECLHDVEVFCQGDERANIATVVCEQRMADLVPDLGLLMETAYLEDRQMFYLQCAMEEDCLAPDAYRIRKENRNWHVVPRRLLRFTTKVLNTGSAGFRPSLPKEAWEWHACHMHYHSMEVFSTYDLTDTGGQRVAEGHKASFCLEDSHCSNDVEPTYSCANFGDQGISVGCADSYAHNIDCQWLDITGLAAGRYQLRVVINGEYKVGEQSWENNAVVCQFDYTETFGSVKRCKLTRP